jgi:Glycine zipper
MDDSVPTSALRRKTPLIIEPPSLLDSKEGEPVETSQSVGVGVGDLMHAVRAEVDRIFKETKGDNLATMKVLTTRLRELDLVTDAEVGALNRMSEIAVEAGAGKRNAGTAYLESIDLHNSLVAAGNASQVALIIGSSVVGSYVPTADPGGSGAVIYSKSGGFWTGWGAAAGAVIGSAIPGVGAALGAAIGGLVGQAVDHCTDRS